MEERTRRASSGTPVILQHYDRPSLNRIAERKRDHETHTLRTPIGILRDILRDADVSIDEFRNL